jgi:AcrR family transcriptional regulator
MGRPKTIQDSELLAVARDLFVEKGIGASTRELARRAGISEAVIYQRYATKAELFFAAMVPPPLSVVHLFQAGDQDADVLSHLEDITLGIVDYFREMMPILVPLMSHPSFDIEEMAHRNPDSPLDRIRIGFMDYLETQQRLGNIAPGNMGPTVLTLVATAHSLALFEMIGAHGGRFDEGIVRAMVRSLWSGIAPQGERGS